MDRMRVNRYLSGKYQTNTGLASFASEIRAWGRVIRGCAVKTHGGDVQVDHIESTLHVV